MIGQKVDQANTGVVADKVALIALFCMPTRVDNLITHIHGSVPTSMDMSIGEFNKRFELYQKKQVKIFEKYLTVKYLEEAIGFFLPQWEKWYQNQSLTM